ncbi:cGMP-dependent protein kinase 1 [Symbiodinium microadriaticum]|uniref:cGMP-dependent protein kinase n=2 Tax=Symbiodinium TaxID=2949 RepID=A0A1Q9CA97_SYMMI|nr:cGMP-dependent protein kinase 1 [Symbiodinium microadriaticum]
MEVYEFQHSEKVVRQGDTDGTHFFVVAQGEFCVLKDNNPHCYIGPGASFGESVLLLFGERNATVCARGCARAYGMEGMQVRELLSKQYEQMRRSVVEATDEVLKSNLCQILSGLNGYELQSLYDQVEMRSFDEGDTILSEGESPKEVLILYSGQVESWKDAQDVEAVPRFHLMGDYALPFKDEVLFEQPTNLRAATPVEVLVLKRSLLDNIFGDQLQQVLVKHRVLHVLAKHQDFSRLHQEHREAIAGSCQIRCLGEGSEQSWEDVRMIVALNGEIELRLEAGPQHLIGAVSDLFAIPYEQQKTSLQLKALGDSKLAVWQREDLGSILAFDDFDGALEQDNKVRSLRSVFIFATLSKQQLQRLANALQIQIVRSGKRVFSQGDQGTHFYIIRKGAVSVEIDGRMKRRLGDPDYFGERALLGSEIRSASITALEDTELWKMGKETFQEMMQGPCLDYLKDRISLQDTNLTFQDLEFVRVIGRGGFGVVKMVRAKKTGVRYALKCVRKRDVVEKNVQDALVSELSILKEVDHPFIIKFVRSFRNESRVYFLMELVSGGELLDALDALGLLKYSQALFYTGCIVLALEFLHSRRIAYLDLKSENCLIDQQGYLKMIDFGIARRITNTRYGPLKGTPMFMAPEMILGKGHTTVADLWSLGICLYEFVIGHFPFASNCSNHGQIFHQILRAELRFPEWFDKQPMADEIISLIRGLLTRDPKKRLGAGHEGYTKLKAHPFFKHLCWEKLLGREQEPPFAPTSETYAEDKERSAGLQAVGDSLPTVEEEEGLEAMRRFVMACVSELTEGLTNKAYNADMLQVLDSCDECFDWGLLCFQLPLRRHADSWRSMVGLLKPFLQHSLWPAMSVSDYAQVNRTWDLPEPALLFQYGLLVERVRCAVSLAFRRRRWSATFDPTGSNVQTAPEEVVQAVVEEWFVLQSVSVRIRPLCAYETNRNRQHIQNSSCENGIANVKTPTGKYDGAEDYWLQDEVTLEEGFPANEEIQERKETENASRLTGDEQKGNGNDKGGKGKGNGKGKRDKGGVPILFSIVQMRNLRMTLAKISGLRSDVFGDLTFADHGENSSITYGGVTPLDLWVKGCLGKLHPTTFSGVLLQMAGGKTAPTVRLPPDIITAPVPPSDPSELVGTGPSGVSSDDAAMPEPDENMPSPPPPLPLPPSPPAQGTRVREEYDFLTEDDKAAEYQSWLDNEVFEFVHTRQQREDFVSGLLYMGRSTDMIPMDVVAQKDSSENVAPPKDATEVVDVASDDDDDDDDDPPSSDGDESLRGEDDEEGEEEEEEEEQKESATGSSTSSELRVDVKGATAQSSGDTPTTVPKVEPKKKGCNKKKQSWAQITEEEEEDVAEEMGR